MTGIKIPVNAEFDGADAEKAVAKLNEQMNRLAQTVAAANKVKFTPVGQGAISELKQVEARFNELLKISGALRDRVKATGQAGTAFGGIDWQRLYEDPALRRRKMQQAFQHVAAGTRYEVAPMAAPGPTPSGARPGAAGGTGGTGGAVHHGPNLAATATGVVGAGVRATGPVGGVVANAASAGMSSGFKAGAFGLLGGLAALGVGKAVGAVKDRIGAAEQEGIGYDTLKRTLGDVNVSFNALRASLRAASYDIDVTFEQAQKLGADFAKISGASKNLDPKEMAKEVAVGGGFGRSFGMDPEQSNQFFAQMRQFRVTENTNDSRRLALMIGEAVGKSGSFAKADEVLQAISSFTATQTRAGLVGANVEGYAGQLAGLMASRTPGLDAQGSAALLGRVNSSIMGGGAAGEAGQNFLYSTLGRPLNLDPVQVAILQQQGAFGTGRKTFGDGSMAQQYYKRFGGSISDEAAKSDKTTLQAIIDRMQEQFKGSPSLMASATARELGINESQAMAMHMIGPQSVGGMIGRMGRLRDSAGNPLDISKLSSTGISALSNIESGDHKTLLAQANALKSHQTPLSDDERNKLNEALADKNDKTGEKLKDVLTELTYTREQERTDGDKTREAINKVEKRTQELATDLVGPMNDMRNAIVWMAGGQGKLGARGINEAVQKVERDEIASAGVARESEIMKRYGGHISAVSGRTEQLATHIRARYAPGAMAGMNPEQQAAYLAETKRMEDELVTTRNNAPGMIKKLEAERDAELSKVRAQTAGELKALEQSYATPPPPNPEKAALTDREKIMRELARTDRELGMSPGTSAAQIGKESSFNPNAYNKKSGAMGLAQVMPKTLAAIEKRVGRKLDPYNENDAIVIHREVMRENKARFGTDAAALAAYNSGWDPSKWGNPETTDYLSTIERNRGYFATPMPEGASPAGSNPQSLNVTVDGTFNLLGPGGQRAADPLPVKKRVSIPYASGVA